MGCGSKLVQAILDREMPMGRYAGVGVFPDLINFLTANAADERFSFHLLNTHNGMYNPNGDRLSANTLFPLQENSFDIICLLKNATALVENTGWEIVSLNDPERLIEHYMICKPG